MFLPFKATMPVWSSSMHWKKPKGEGGTKLAEAIAKTKDLQVANGKFSYDEHHNPITTALILELKDGVQTLVKKING